MCEMVMPMLAETAACVHCERLHPVLSDARGAIIGVGTKTVEEL